MPALVVGLLGAVGVEIGEIGAAIMLCYQLVKLIMWYRASIEK